jgi:hypothetical protein
MFKPAIQWYANIEKHTVPNICSFSSSVKIDVGLGEAFPVASVVITASSALITAMQRVSIVRSLKKRLLAYSPG